ncbi:hypothetical protein [Bradyrhizobium oligotrophicum]|uniref:hypothetical protein n=1 Tax=Bradyrhizobium oligotrophicum TaxID=44255 RepID=UPI001181AB60|nr:hypothetical protein [Bradyrhizobium oligotrophicum]
MNDKRPKSREETPKEGSDNAERYRTATICIRAAQSARVFRPFSMQKTQAGFAPDATRTDVFIRNVNGLIEKSDQPKRLAGFTFGFGSHARAENPHQCEGAGHRMISKMPIPRSITGCAPDGFEIGMIGSLHPIP